MAVKGILPDTCAWIEYFNPRLGGLGRALEKALTGGQVFLCGPVLAELVQGVRSDEEKRILLRSLGAVGYLEMTRKSWIRAGELSAKLRKAGVTVPFSDLLIAVQALEHELGVLTVDRHFNLIPGVRTVS